jgi:hypothetical protein
MLHFSPKIVTTLALVTALSLAATSQAQTQAKLVSASTNSRSSHSLAQQNAAWHDTAPNQLITAHVRNGVLTIDGMVGKVQLNYDIERTGFMYFFVPGVGTAVVSMEPMADAVKVPDAFDGDTLAFTAGGHSFELSSEGNLLSKRKKQAKADVYVRLDSATVALGRYPQMGFGDTTEPPYVWPLSEVAPQEKVEYVVPPPPMPKSVLPQTVETASMHSQASH